MKSRSSLLRSAFCDVPNEIAGLTLRPCSPGSFALLGEVKNRLVTPGENSAATMADIFDSIVEYIWVHTAPLDQVCAVQSAADLPRDEIRRLGFMLEMGDALEFMRQFTAASLKMSASLAELEDEDDAPGKPAARATVPTGLPISSTPSEPLETPSGSDTSCGTPRSSEHSATSMPPMSPMEAAADSPVPLMTLPSLPQTPPA